MSATVESEIQHLAGCSYLVPSHMIRYAEGEIDSEEDTLSFKNPRRTMVNGQPNTRGFEKDRMSMLREAIRTEGMHTPLLLRGGSNLGNEELIIIDGERRKRCIDKLIKDGEECFDPSTNSYRPAKEVYGKIECKIYSNIDDKSAFKHAFSANENSEPIGEGATVALIRYWRKCGWSDTDILEVTGMSTTWLRETEQLCALDEKTFGALAEDEINRTVAIHLSKVTDVNERLARLAVAREFAAKRIASLQEKAAKEMEKAEEDAELAEAQVVAAEHSKNAHHKAVAQKKLKKAKTKIEKKAKVLKAEKKVTIKDVHKAVEKATGESGKSVTMSKFKKHYHEAAETAIKEMKKEDDTELAEKYADCDLEDFYLVKLIGDSMEKGHRDLIKIIKAHKKNKLTRAE